MAAKWLHFAFFITKIKNFTKFGIYICICHLFFVILCAELCIKYNEQKMTLNFKEIPQANGSDGS